MTASHAAGVGAAVLCPVVAAFQLGLALGVPLGEATWGGRATTRDGVLSSGFRVAAAASAGLLGAIAWIVLARAGVVDAGDIGERLLVPAAWTILGFLVLNAVGNFAAPHPVERWVIGPVALTTGVLVALVALGAP
jgi:hypothetical protein